eukprot:gb/GEZN01006114.1/.p1 GENE.gb/GEZN01006114.1/~~gb/GEZN01006114.1/.p1  ORF type:complete len:526 (+),score=70.54 gb/GEZN01006114.1/:34-1611(+)
MQTYTLEEVALHNKREDAWVVVDGAVLDVSKFAKMHPAGAQIIVDVAGTDVSDAFWSFHRSEVLQKYQKKLQVGVLQGKSLPASPVVQEGYELISQVPYAEHKVWQDQDFKSPYFTESHKRFRLAVRAFVEKEVLPDMESLSKFGKPPSVQLFQKMGSVGLLAAFLGPGKHIPVFMRDQALLGGVKWEEYDFFHEMIAHEEVYRIGDPGFSDGLACGLVIGLPPVFKFGSKELAARVVPEVLSGSKRISLAISEPAAGSDVANIQCRAVKSPCGTYYTVTGIKKWITNGHDSHYFSTAVRTGGPGLNGVSLLLIERGPGVTTKKIPTAYSGSAGTSWVIFEEVKVPVANLLGTENQGFKCIMHNFNHERWFISIISVSCSRHAFEETIKWVMQRRAFGKSLMDQPVVRGKLADMLSRLEACQTLLESVTYQMNSMSYEKQNAKLAGPICLLKLECARMNEVLTNDAAQLLGGRGITASGMGAVIQRYRSANQYNGILGGTNEVLGDFAIRQIQRGFPKDTQRARL